MSAHIKRLQPKDKQEKQKLIQQLQFLLEQFPEHENKATSLLWEIKRRNKLNDPNTWTFIMISPEQNLAVVNWLTSKSKRPLNAVKLWALLFDNVHRETGQIMLTRQEIADELKIQSANVTRIMTELESINAIFKKKNGRGVVYYMNPNVANHYPQEIREKLQKEAKKLKLLDGGLI
ncbi:replication/maintenance protein RepL [Commensalibacter nepenthis]|uniref:Replication/maintenance protein RepL n=1 Tax=Commensalibacter nepenthis TaxID=3043872 RepID=A0ABT6QAM3_9PROT|nr:replication/maintenance protein RepL [Commensalibacter sp. TBRC 10068]MDI2113960.1 replication/maintenance protein RepL [Commensalibacter sp. TBRC 10068]